MANNELRLTIPLPPSINSLYINQFSYNPKTKTRIPTGKRIMGKEGIKVKKEIQEAARKQLANQEWDYEWTKDNFIYQDAWFYMNRVGRDDDNCLKLMKDSLEGIIYDNDSRVLSRTMRLLVDKCDPRVELVITQAPHRGIFTSQEHLDEFENTYCSSCKRMDRNCSINKEAREGRVQEHITQVNDKFECAKYNQKK